MILAGTGHRPQKLGGFSGPDYEQYKEYVQGRIHAFLNVLKPERVISGMALGYDQWLAQVAIERSIPLVAAVPCSNHSAKWPEHSQRVWQAILDQAAEVVMVSDKPYNNHCMQDRNIWMVDHCDILLACWDGSTGGTKNCVDYALHRGFKIFTSGTVDHTKKWIMRFNPHRWKEQ